MTTPWVANGMLRIDGAEHRLGGFDRILSTKLDEQPTCCEFQLSGKDVKLRGRVSSEPRNFVAWIYADPKGPEHNTLNCSIADLELEVERRGREPERLELSGAAAYEIGMRQTDHGIPRAAVSRRLEPRHGGRAPHRARRRASACGSAPRCSCRPSRVWSAGPEAFELPREPTTRARTIRGESPVLQDLDLPQPAGEQPREPRLDLGLRVADRPLVVRGRPRRRGPARSSGTGPARRPGKPNWTLSVCPPEVEKK